MKKTSIILTVLILTVFSTISFSQISGAYSLNDPVSAAMGNVSVSNSTGTYAVHRNPANLAYMPNESFEFATIFPLPNLAINVGTDFMTINEYNYYFGGVEVNGVTVPRELTPEDKENLKNLFADGGIVYSSANIDLMNFVFKPSDEIGTFGFSVSYSFAETATFPQGLVELTLDGNVVGRAYDFNDLDFKGSLFRDYTFSYSRDFSDLLPKNDIVSKLAAGVSVSYVQGLAMARTEEVKTNIVTNADNTIDIEGHFVGYAAVSPDFNIHFDFDSLGQHDSGFHFSPFPTPAGSGFGFDFGLNAELIDAVNIGFAINNIGSITWNNYVARYESNTALVIKDITDQDELDSLSNSISLSGEFVDSYVTDLPTVMRLGASVQVDKLVNEIPGTLLVAADVIKGFNDEASNSSDFGFGLGVEWRPLNWLPIMTGLAFGNGRPSMGWSLGTGVDVGPFSFTIAAHNFGSVISGNDAKTINYVMGSRFRF